MLAPRDVESKLVLRGPDYSTSGILITPADQQILTIPKADPAVVEWIGPPRNAAPITIAPTPFSG